MLVTLSLPLAVANADPNAVLMRVHWRSAQYRSGPGSGLVCHATAACGVGGLLELVGGWGWA